MNVGTLKYPFPVPITGIWSIARVADDDDEDEDEFMNIAIRLWSCMAMIPCMTSRCSNDESLALGDGVGDDDDVFLSLFFIVEFQKFFISLSVRPGKRAAIWDHL